MQGDDGMAAAKIATASTLPDFQVVALDQWENPTGPCPEMSFELVVASEALAPPKKSFQFQPQALVTGKALTRSWIQGELCQDTWWLFGGGASVPSAAQG